MGRSYYQRNKERIKARVREYYWKHRDRIKEKRRVYRLSHKDEIAKWNRDYYRRNKARIREQAKEWYQKNREKVLKRKRERERARHLEARLAAIKALGGQCIRCGFADFRALQIDHVFGGGRKELLGEVWGKEGYIRYYQRIAADPNKEKYQLLCANCNWIKRWEQGEVNKIQD